MAVVGAATPDADDPRRLTAAAGVSGYLIPAILLLCLCVQCLWFMHAKSVTADETIFIKTAYQFLVSGVLNEDDANPVLTTLLAAVPLLPLKLAVDPPEASHVCDSEYGYAFFYHNPKPERTLWLARLPSLCMGLLLGWVIYDWTRRLYGRTASLFALFLYAFNPLVISLSSVATPDIGSCLLMFCALYAFRAYLVSGKIGALLVTAVVTGLALCAKHTAVILLPSFPLLAIGFMVAGKESEAKALRSASGSRFAQWRVWTGHALLAGLVVLLVINAVYGFRQTCLPLADLPLAQEPAFRDHDVFGRLLGGWTARMPVPLPYSYLRSLGSVIARTAVDENWSCFLMGTMSSEGWWYYFIVAFLLKTPIAFTVFLFSGLGSLLVGKRGGRAEAWYLLIPAAILFVMASTSSTQIGIRHIVFIYPPLTVLCGACAASVWSRGAWGRPVCVALVAWQVLSVSWHAPHYLAYFNEVVGGPDSGHRYLIDSNIDWGQDVGGLVPYMDEHEIETIWFGNWMPLDPRTQDRVRELPCGPTTGWVAVPVNTRKGLKAGWGVVPEDCYDWLRDREPLDKIGYSIFIYHFPDAEKVGPLNETDAGASGVGKAPSGGMNENGS